MILEKRWFRGAVDLGTSALIALICLFPIAWGLSTSLKPAGEILSREFRIIPETFSLEHYRTLLEQNITGFFFNSVIVSLVAVLLVLCVGAMAGYAMARYEFRGKGALRVLVILIMCVPITSLLVPTFSLVASAGMLNTRTALVLLYAAYELPLAIWILQAFFQTIPVELERAAMMDGYNRFEVIRKIILPLSTTGLVSAGLFVLTFTWNDFVVALVMTTDDTVRTLPIAIYNYLGYYGRDWGPLTAGAMISIVPLIILFLIFQRYFMSGMTGGSVKG